MHGKNVMVAQVFSKTPLNISFRMEPLTELNGLLGAPNGKVNVCLPLGGFILLSLEAFMPIFLC